VNDKEKDECYPTIAHNIKVWMQERPTGGWRWYIKHHVEGPDDVFDFESEFFETKKECLVDMERQYPLKIVSMVDLD